MKNSYNKILAIILFLIILISAVFLFISIAKIYENNIINIDKLVSYNLLIIFIMLIILTDLAFIITIFNLENKNKILLKLKTNKGKKKVEKKAGDTDKLEKQKNIQKNINILKTLQVDLRKQESIEKYSEKLLSNIAKHYPIVQGIVFILNTETAIFNVSGTYAYYSNEKIREFSYGEGISGQVAKNREYLLISNIPDNYITILSGTGKSSPKNLLIFPILFKNNSIGIIELASFENIGREAENIFMLFSESIGKDFERLSNYDYNNYLQNKINKKNTRDK